MSRLAWHFAAIKDGRPIMRDGTPIEIGRTYRVDGPLVMCEHGLHWSRTALDALRYAPGPYVMRVRPGGDMLHDADKSCSTERTVISGVDATNTLRHFARLCALDVIHLWDVPEIVVQYLRTGDERLRAAAWAAAQAAAQAATQSTAWAAACSATQAAAGAAAWSAAWSAARSTQSRRLSAMLSLALREAS